MITRRASTFALGLAAWAALALTGVHAQDATTNPIAFRTEIYVVSEVTLDDGTKQERFTEATSAIPGQVVEYRIFATNAGETTLPAGRVQIYGPVQEMMEFVANSATADSERVLTEYSVDGETFAQPPVLVGEGEERRVADPSEYVMVRWTLLVPMEPGQEEPFFYRVVVR